VLALAGDGGNGGVAVPVAGAGGVAVNLGLLPGVAVGGSSVAIGDASGGNGGNVVVLAVPIALSGSSGGVSAQSSSTNTGDTGPAWSGAVSVPIAISGSSGSTGATGPATSNPTAINLGLLGFAIVFDI
ncbi:MAG: hypothetical protein M3159_07580, partial [Actinomycetota bacterium]|nr:hypothetical protein [Actinomycetota bacterium]